MTLSRKISMPLLGKITVWGFDLLFLLSSILNLGRIEALFFLIYALINVGVAIYLYHKTGVGYKSIWLVGAFHEPYYIHDNHADQLRQRRAESFETFCSFCFDTSSITASRAVFKQLILSIAIEWNL